VFDPQITRYIEFIQRAKTVGLSLKEMKRLLELARKGKNPCPQVMKWADDKAIAVDQQIRTLRALQQRLGEFRNMRPPSYAVMCFRPGEMCCLIEDLPNPQNGGSHAKAVPHRSRRVNHAGS
jgi:hypothetical protein